MKPFVKTQPARVGPEGNEPQSVGSISKEILQLHSVSFHADSEHSRMTAVD